ncbi:MAG: DUF2948 family protein [Pseudomonadota bacterium]
MTLKKLIAFDEADLAVMSAYVQDAHLKASDMAYLPNEQRFAFVAQRYAREDGHETHQRSVGMHFEAVQAVRSTGFSPGSDDDLQLLAIHFQTGDAPAGTLQMIFAGNAEIHFDVECLEAAMSDLGDGGVCSCPQHNLA